MNLVISQNTTETVVSLTVAKNFLRVTTDQDDLLIPVLVAAAVEAVEAYTGRSVATKVYVQSFDAFPYYVDSAVSQSAYPPNYYALPMYSSSEWNYSQMMKLFAPPLIEVLSIVYTDPNGNIQTLAPSAYIVDTASEPARIFPAFGMTWPAMQAVPNSVQVTFVAGYNTNPSSAGDIPNALYVAILLMTAHLYENRGENAAEMPKFIENLLYSQKVMDQSPTRG